MEKKKVLVTMTVEGFYKRIFCKLKLNEVVCFCTTNEKCSRRIEEGEDWLCAERVSLPSGEVYTILHSCDSNGPALITSEPSYVDVDEVISSIDSCCSRGLDKIDGKEVVYVEMDEEEYERDSDMHVIDEEIYGDKEEHNIDLQFRDGIAVGMGKDEGLVMIYPTFDRLTDWERVGARQYQGLPADEPLKPRDICLAFGRLVKIKD